MKGPVFAILLSLVTLSSAQTWSVARSGLPATLVGGNVVKLDVTGRTDTIFPNATGLTLSANLIDVTSSAWTVTATFTAMDSGSGLAWGGIQFESPDGKNRTYGFCSSSGTPSAWHATMSCSVTFQRWTASGAWKISSLSVSDNAGNTKYYTGADFPQTVTVASVPDVTVPFAWSFDFAPQNLVVRRGEYHEDFYIAVAANDTQSGISSVSAYFEHSIPEKSIYLTLSQQDPVWDDKGGYYSASGSTLFAETDFQTNYPIAGTWTLKYVTISDLADNSVTLKPGTPGWQAHWPTQVTVRREFWPTIRRSDTFPVLLDVTADKTSVNTVNGTVHVNYKVTIQGDAVNTEARLCFKGPVVDGVATWRQVSATVGSSTPVTDKQITDGNRVLTGTWDLNDYAQPLGNYDLVGVVIFDWTGQSSHAFGELTPGEASRLVYIQEALGRLPSSASALAGSGLLALAASLVMAAVHML